MGWVGQYGFEPLESHFHIAAKDHLNNINPQFCRRGQFAFAQHRVTQPLHQLLKNYFGLSQPLFTLILARLDLLNQRCAQTVIGVQQQLF
jgi:hypothetical protein